MIQGDSWCPLHGRLLGRLLEVSGIDAESFAHLLGLRCPEFGAHLPALIQKWMSGSEVPDSPVPLLLALQLAVLAIGCLPSDLVDLLQQTS